MTVDSKLVTRRAAPRRAAGIAVVAALLAGLVAATSAPAAAAVTPTIGARLTATQVRVRTPVHVRGRLDPPGFTPNVVVQRLVDGRWSDRVVSGPIGADGVFDIELVPSSVGTYVLRVRSAGGTVVSNTLNLEVTPVPTISAALSQSAITIGSPLLLSGTVRPAGATPRVVMQRLIDGRWVDRATVAVNPSSGAYMFGVTPTQATGYTLRVRSAKGSVVSGSSALSVTYVGNDMVDFGQARPGEKVIALTFDDGPTGTYTPRLLAVLAKYGVTATFAVVGYEVEDRPDLVRRLVAAGHHVANHTWDHAQLTKLGDAAVSSQLARTDDQIVRAGASSRCVRPPYGSHNARVDRLIGGLHASATLMWNVNPDDYTLPGTDVIVSRVMAGLRPGAIVGLHDGGGPRQQTVDAMDIAIPRILAAGYRIRPVC